MRFIMAF